jgi:hypothetical protein
VTHRHPPRAAAWLLDCFVGRNQALIGDIAEEYRTGRTQLWFWRQTVMAALRSTFAEIQSHWILALRAAIFGGVFLFCFNYCIVRPFGQFYTDVMWNVDPILVSGGWSFRTLLFITFLPDVPVLCLGFAVGSWIVARLHRPYKAAFTLMNAAVVLVVGTVQIVVGVVRLYIYVGNYQKRHYDPDPHHFWFYVIVCFWVFELSLFVASTLAGGLWNRPSAAVDSV